MIEYAESREGFVLDATITGKFLDYDSNRWYIEYTLKDHAKTPVPSTAIIDPYLTSTYSIYTEEQIKNYRVNDTIKVAVDSIPVTTNTDSMVVEYKNFKIEDDGEYIELSKTHKKFNTIAVFLNIGAVVCLISGIAFGVKFTKKAKEYIENNQNSSSSGSSTTSSGTPTKKCGYCGYTSSSSGKCPQCGAHLK
jgi:rubrerythrin